MTIKKRKSPQKIDQFINKLLKKWKTTREQQAFLLGTIWVKIVGEQIAKYTQPQTVIQQKLIVLVKSSAWMNELTFMKETIKIKAKSLFLEHHIEVNDVVFKLGNEKKHS